MRIRNLVLNIDVVVKLLTDHQPLAGVITKVFKLADELLLIRWLVASSLPGLFSKLIDELSTQARAPAEIPGELSATDRARKALKSFQKEVKILSSNGFSADELFDTGDPGDRLLLRAADRLGDGTVIICLDEQLKSLDSRVMTPEEVYLNLNSPHSKDGPVPFIDLIQQQYSMIPSLERKINKVLQNCQFIMGPEIDELESSLAKYVGVKHAITVSNGTDALLLAMMALNIQPGDEVITTPFTFIATGEMIALLKARPVFVDIDPNTYNINPSLIESAITNKTKAIIPVSLYGQCADFDAINSIARKFGIPVIEDGAQSFGATYKGRTSCSLSEIGCTSFFPSKPLGCYGDGGACFTNDDNLAKLMKQIRLHGQDKRYHHPIIGINGRMNTLQAAVLLVKLATFKDEVETRVRIGNQYSEMLKNLVLTPTIEPFNTCVYAQYTIQSDDRDKLAEKLNSEKIPTAVHYPVPLHLQPAFSSLSQGEGSFPVSERAAKRVLSLPMHPFLKQDEMKRIVATISRALGQ